MVCVVIADAVPTSTSDAAEIAMVLLGLGVVLSRSVAHMLSKLQNRLSFRREQTAGRSLRAFAFGCAVLVFGLVLTTIRPSRLKQTSPTVVPATTAVLKPFTHPPKSSGPNVEPWDGTYVGTVQNVSAGLDANISLTLKRQNKLAITGYFSVTPPLHGSGPCSGICLADGTVQFQVIPAIPKGGLYRYQMEFKGHRTGDGVVKGSYTVTNGESGTFAIRLQTL